MGAQRGLVSKLHLCKLLLSNKKIKDVLVVSCEFCNDMNVCRVNRKQTESDGSKEYNATYKCCTCGATCKAHQIWKMEGL